MYLQKLTLLNFKNIAQGELTFGPGINCLVGDNGAGKTNLVDAVHYLSMCKSAFGMTDGQTIRHGEEFFMAEGHYTTDSGRSERVVCSFSRRSGKLLKRNDKEYDRLADHVGLIPAVVVSPADGSLISDAADERRRFLNAFLSTLDRAYLTALMRYNAVLGERNRLLKLQPDETMLAIYDRQLVEHGNTIHARRHALVERMQPIVAAYYRRLSGDREQVELRYRSELDERPFEELLLAARQKDLVNEFTTSGIHRDDLVLRIGGYPLRKYGSQGQQKSFLIALKLAQYAVLAEERGERPILLLDDLFDKLDAGRVEQLIRLVSEEQFGQILITDCNPTRLKAILDRAGASYWLYRVADGVATASDATTPDSTASDGSAQDSTAERAADDTTDSTASETADGGPDKTSDVTVNKAPGDISNDGAVGTPDESAADTPNDTQDDTPNDKPSGTQTDKA